MGLHSGVSWCDASWSPWEGCTRVSDGCKNCYAERLFKRFHKDFHTVRRTSDKTFYAPLKWKGNLKIMVCPQGDFFHPDADKWRRDALVMIDRLDQHTFIIPTKRTERIIECLYGEYGNGGYVGHNQYMENVWFLASVENQATADKRIPELLRLREYGDWPVLGVSYEPVLGKVDFGGDYQVFYNNLMDTRCATCRNITGYLPSPNSDRISCRVKRIGWPHFNWQCSKWFPKLDWLIMGGQSGSGARPMHPNWVRETRDACVAAGIPFYFKQWGEWMPWIKHPHSVPYTKGKITEIHDWDNVRMFRVGTKAAGNLIDGDKWEQFPEVKE